MMTTVVLQFRTEDAILERATTICMCTIGSRLRTMFDLGDLINALITLKKQIRGPQDVGVTNAEAIRKVQTHCLKNAETHGYSMPRGSSYWKGAARAASVWTPEQRTILIEHNTSWSVVNWLLSQPLNGKTMIKKLSEGAIPRIPQPYITVKRIPIQREKNQATDAARTHLSPDYEATCLIKRCGVINDEGIVDFLRHLSSVIGYEKLHTLFAEVRHD